MNGFTVKKADLFGKFHIKTEEAKSLFLCP